VGLLGNLVVAIDAHSRFLVRHELQFRAKRNNGAGLPFFLKNDSIDVCHIFTQAIKNKKADQTIKLDDAIELKKVDIREDDGIGILLFERSDPGGITQMYKHSKTKAIRPSDRTVDEAIATSAHVFNRLDYQNVQSPIHEVLIEEAQGLSKSYLMSFMDYLLAKYSYQTKDSRGHLIETVCKAQLRGHPSETMKNAMKDSFIRNVILVRPGKFGGMDSEHFIVKDDIMRIQIKPEAQKMLSVIQDICGIARAENWNDIRVQIDMPTEGKSRIVSLDKESDAAEALFVRAIPVNVSKPIPACCQEIHEELLQKALEIFKKDEK
jgi:hypothetical protein